MGLALPVARFDDESAGDRERAPRRTPPSGSSEQGFGSGGAASPAAASEATLLACELVPASGGARRLHAVQKGSATSVRSKRRHLRIQNPDGSCCEAPTGISLRIR